MEAAIGLGVLDIERNMSLLAISLSSYNGRISYILDLTFLNRNKYNSIDSPPEFYPTGMYYVEIPFKFSGSVFIKTYNEIEPPQDGELKVKDDGFNEEFEVVEVPNEEIKKTWGIKEVIKNLPTLPFEIGN